MRLELTRPFFLTFGAGSACVTWATAVLAEVRIRHGQNQLINWRMCKKKQMCWSKPVAQYLLQVKAAVINGQLQPFIATHPVVMTACPSTFLRSPRQRWLNG